MKINTIRKSDYEQLHNLYTQLIQEESNIDDMIRILETEKNNSNFIVFGVYDDQDVLRGTATLSKCIDLTGDARYYYSMENFVIDESCRGMGYGSFLLQELEKYVVSNNGRYISFTSTFNRHGAHMFYKKNGYDIDYVKGFKKVFHKEV